MQILLGQKSTHLDEVHHVFKCSYIVETRITSFHFLKDIYIRPASKSGHHKTHNGSYVSLGKVPQSLLSRATELQCYNPGTRESSTQNGKFYCRAPSPICLLSVCLPDVTASDQISRASPSVFSYCKQSNTRWERPGNEATL